MIPPQLLKEAEAAAKEYCKRQYSLPLPEVDLELDFEAGVRWLFQRLLEMSEAERKEVTVNGRATGKSTELIVCLQAALLKARDERDIAITANELNFKKYLAGIEKERARCERLERALNWIANNASSFGLEGEPYVERARQALSGDAE